VGFVYNKINVTEKSDHEKSEKNINSQNFNNESNKNRECEDILDLPSAKKEKNSFEDIIVKETSFNYIPRLVDKSIRLPINNKDSSDYKKIKEIVKNHMEYASLEMDYNKLEKSQDHIEAAIYYLRNMNA
jgi:hypothetical protein